MRTSTQVVLAAALAACAPGVATPLERQRAVDREDSAQLAAQLAALPGVVRSDVVLRRAVADPLGPPASAASDSVQPSASRGDPCRGQPKDGPGTRASSSAVIIVDDRADRAAIIASARSLARALVPDVEPAIVVEIGAVRPELARVGPFTVEAAAKTRLKVTLAIAFGLIALLAGYIAWAALRQRRGNSAQ